jgi:predicted transcriptional regulator
MEIHLTPEQEAHLFQVAEHEGKKPEQLVIDAALGLLAGDNDFRHAVRQGLAQADTGNFIEEEEMDARFEKLMRS